MVLSPSYLADGPYTRIPWPRKFDYRKGADQKALKQKPSKKNRLKKSVFRKAAQYSLECESDVFVMIRTRRNGQRFVFNSSVSERWLPSMQELVSGDRSVLQSHCNLNEDRMNTIPYQ
ncbi:hypothetical protein ASPBRDRAFT_49535 [Aspergillus brasiliensis CBS 101740]|uniref:MADS-box domain-containing protein n=1 Tax=Aspergillus brasiliensis (strain CBS 101740 / IMI 381727 / IBT 21946) TaxID=767769 RepID=A0A1L9U247_ASPBC|nr:hypothetical protein ASPBRDRAFT_49535 [Aspergillus brasiliensis CBS 101740]